VVVKLAQRQVFVYEGQRITSQYLLAVGQKGWETPIGSFQVLHMWQNPKWKHPITGQVFPPGPDNPLGSRWIGFWSDGHTEIGFHGTNQEDLIGQAVSHGCLRMYNRDVEALYQRVAQGTPIIVQQ
jgi:lipoprotein-anchoring transpeptidase ErfK/SrfK